MTVELLESKRSPEWMRLSIGADLALGFSPGRFLNGAKCSCINLLQSYPDGCKANCLYCGLARENPGFSHEKRLIRVEWPLRPMKQIAERIAERQGDEEYCLQRVCIGQLVHANAARDVVTTTQMLRDVGVELQISELLTPTVTTKEDLKAMNEAGGNMADMAIDVANPELFAQLRGLPVRSPHIWSRYLEGVVEAVEVFGKGNAGIHLVYGLGETEKDAVELMLWAHGVGATIHLFCFYPQEGTQLGGKKVPSLNSYRRIQLSRYLIEEGKVGNNSFEFSPDGTILNINANKEMSTEALAPAFMTSGCPGCNRPYSNERPFMKRRNFPWYPSQNEAEHCVKQSRLPVIQ